MLAVTGRRSTIVTELEQLLAGTDPIVRIDAELGRPGCSLYQTPNAERYLLAAGVLYAKPIREQTAHELIESVSVNMLTVISLCEMVLDEQAEARICVIGSDSARAGSFDQTYAACKAAVHAYVMQRKTKPLQQLVCVSPPIIADSGMTRRRKDYPEVLERRPNCTALEVARIVKRVLYDRRPDECTGCIVNVPASR